jgi:hypothetical protein
MPRQDWLVIIAKEDRQPEPRLGRHSDARERASDGCAQPETTENSERDRTGSSPIRGPLSSSITPAGALSEAAVELKPWQLHAQQLQTRTKRPKHGRVGNASDCTRSDDGRGQPQRRAQIKTLEARRSESDRCADILRIGGQA